MKATDERQRAGAGDFVGLVGAAIALLFLYGTLSRHWTPIGGTKGRFFQLEVPLFIFAAWLGYVRLASSRPAHRALGWLCACVPPLLLFVLIDAGFAYLQRGLRVSDLANLGALFEASPGLATGVVLTLTGVLVIPALRLRGLARCSSGSVLLRWLLGRAVAAVLFGVVCTAEVSPFRHYAYNVVHEGDWSEQWAARRCGRFASTMYLYIRRGMAFDRIRRVDLTIAGEYGFDRSITAPRNVHIIVLESFIDPRLLEGVEFDPSPLHPSMRALLGTGDFDLVTSPVYGGGTAQTEFELLTGVPALARVESIEFNALEGHPVPSLVAALRAQGYKTVATIAARPLFYNSQRAYRSLGFEEVHFFDGNSYLGTQPELQMFDGELLEKNLEYVSSKFLTSTQPCFNYVVGMYGHHPYYRDQDLRPNVCRLVPDGDGDSQIERVANQFYYRTQALATHIKALRDRDPSAIVFVTSDHLPPLLSEHVAYRHSSKHNICAAFAAGVRVPWPLQPTFHAPYSLFGVLSGNPLPVPPQATLVQRYFATMAAGLGVTPK
jgi:hypothetical protein